VTAHPEALVLRSALWPRSGATTDAALILGGAAAVAACAQISINLGFTPVPITGQTFAALVVATSLGVKRGMGSLLVYLLAGAVGLPVYAGQEHGLDVLVGATGGYLVGMVAAAALTGWLAERRWDRQVSSSISAMLCGNVVIYVCGLVWLHHHLAVDWPKALEFGLYPFVFGDLLKLYLAALILPGAWALVARVRGGSSARKDA
jgi:biotin transport system substrate-specific component